MAGDEGVFVLCLNILRWMGLSFTRIRRSPGGDFVAEDSKLHLLVNVGVAGAFLLGFSQIDPTAFAHAAEAYKSSTIVYPLYTKLMILTIVAFLLCGNVYNRKFFGMINLFLRVTRDAQRDFGDLGQRRDKTGRKILLRFGAYMGATTAFNLWADAHLTVHYRRTFRIVHYFCFCYATLFTTHFVVTMNYVGEKFRQVNGALGRMVGAGRRPPAVAPPAGRRRLGAWMAAVMELREAEGLANEIFGKQVFLTLLLAFSSVIVNAYYLITLNLYGTSSPWLNVTMWVGFLQAVTVALMNTRAAESAAEEANRVNEIIFNFSVRLRDWQMFNQVKYFALFTHRHPVEFKAWVFYAVNYDSLLKVVLTSSAITAVILQCDFLSGRLDASG